MIGWRIVASNGVDRLILSGFIALVRINIEPNLAVTPHFKERQLAQNERTQKKNANPQYAAKSGALHK